MAGALAAAAGRLSGSGQQSSQRGQAHTHPGQVSKHPRLDSGVMGGRAGNSQDQPGQQDQHQARTAAMHMLSRPSRPYPDIDTLLQAAHRTTDYMYIDTDTLLQAAHRTTDYMYIDTCVENSSLYRAATRHRYIITSSAQDNRLYVHRHRCRE